MHNKKARVIAFYLPQFHPIPENNEWWGKGFTEWTNVGKAKPLFKGHYQPRVPADLGYYDLRLPQIREEQAEMARNSGIEGFMYWHYYFGNKRRVLEKPFMEVLESGKPDFPFCLGWANHSWTSHSWNSSKQWKKDSIIIEQRYLGKEDYIEHFFQVLPAFLDNRYIKVDGKPIFMIYAPFDFPDVKYFIELWNELALKNGLKGIYFIARSYGWISNNKKILEMGFDGINSNGQWEAESAVKGKLRQLIEANIVQKFGGLKLLKYEYSEIIKHFFTLDDTFDNIFPTVIPQWDRTPRSGRRGVIYKGSNPKLFEIHLKEALKLIEDKPKERKIIFLKSWNEWAEGNYVEPDLEYGHGFLDVIRNNVII